MLCGFYADEKIEVAARDLIIMSGMNGPAKKCDICSHSSAAHVDGVRCALCDCTSERREVVQQTLAFRSILPSSRAILNTRKRQ
jgi:hypothetical protein